MKDETKSNAVLNFTYEEMLERALKQIPAEIKTELDWTPPTAEIMIEGGRTIIVNWKDIIQRFNRDDKIVMRFLEHRLGTIGWVLKGKGILQGIYKRSRINKFLDFFAREYVICDVCGRPHTVLTKEKGRWIKKCNACGAWRVVERI